MISVLAQDTAQQGGAADVGMGGAADPQPWTVTVTEYAIANGPRVLGVLALLFVAWVASRWLRRLVLSGLVRARFDQTLAKFFANATRWIILLLAVLACLETFGIKSTSVAAVVGAAGLAVGLGFQGSLSNLAAGVMLLVFRPFKLGDTVIVCGHLGKVDGIDLFTTNLDTPDNRRIVLPNGQIFGSVIENITHHPRRRADVKVGAAYGADIDRTRAALEAAAALVQASQPGALKDPTAKVVLVELGASSVNWEVRLWAASPEFLSVKQALTAAVKRSLDEAKIVIPFPQMDLWIRELPRERGAGD